MKYIRLSLFVFCCMLFVACLKKEHVAPQSNIKITASGEETFYITLSDPNDPLRIYFKTIFKGDVFDEDFKALKGAQLSIKLNSPVKNSISYEIFQNQESVLKETSKSITDSTTLSVLYTVK